MVTYPIISAKTHKPINFLSRPNECKIRPKLVNNNLQIIYPLRIIVGVTIFLSNVPDVVVFSCRYYEVDPIYW
jgi:hypothetical protein